MLQRLERLLADGTKSVCTKHRRRVWLSYFWLRTEALHLGIGTFMVDSIRRGKGHFRNEIVYLSWKKNHH